MRSVIKLMLAMTLCLLMLTAVGCGGREDGGVVKDYEEAPKVTLSVITNATLVDDLWDEGFVAADGTRINVVEYSSEYYEKEGLSYRELVLKRLESNVDIDCYVVHAEDVISFSRLDYWMDLSSLEAAGSLSADAVWQSTYEGKVFSIPLTYTGFGFYWNVDMLAEHDLSVPGNLSEFLHVCQRLKEDGITPYLGNKGYALTVPAMAMGFAEVYAADNSQQLLAELADGTTPVSDYMLDGFAFVEMMIEKGYMDPEQALNTTPRVEDVEGFLAGEGAVICAALRDFDDADFTVKMTGVPALEKGTVAVVGADSRLAINPHSPYVEYTVELLDGMITPEWLAEVAIRTHALSSGKGEYDLSYLGEACEDFARLVQQGNQIPNQDFSFPFNTWEAIRDLCREICAGASAEEAAQAYDLIQQEQIAEAQL